MPNRNLLPLLLYRLRTISAFLLAVFISCTTAAHAAEAARVVFVAGATHAGSTPLQLGSVIQEGDRIVTGADGYLYLKTIDAGFLILRPNTDATIVAYRIDDAHPENTRIKFELTNGVARSISGEGVKRARQNFRFNTPVAAIGVRGTDFTVFTDQNTSRVAVIVGGVIVSPLSGGCLAEGSGPCEGALSRELFANQRGQLLQIDKGQVVPQLIRGVSPAPDGAAPARADEPVAKLSYSNTSTLTEKDADLQKTLQNVAASAPAEPVVVVPVVVMPPPIASQITWGRWQPVLDQAASASVNADLAKVAGGSVNLIGLVGPFALLREKSAEWQVPRQGTMGFALQQSEAYMQNSVGGIVTSYSAAKIENGVLNVDFAKASFSTSLDFLSKGERFKLQAKGDVSPNGLLQGDGQFKSPTNMIVTGVLGAQKSETAAYLFQSRIDETRNAVGATAWGKAAK